MAHMRATVRIEIEHDDGSTTVVERSITPQAFGANAIFYGDVAEQAVHAVEGQVRDAIESVHGKAPHPARVTLGR